MKKILYCFIIISLIVNFSIELAYSVSYDSVQGWTTYLYLPDGEMIRFEDGESKTISVPDNQLCCINQFAEFGWDKKPLKPKTHVKLSLKNTDAIKPDIFKIMLVAGLVFPNKETKVLIFSPELPERTYPGRSPVGYLSAELKKHGFEVLIS
ncbi:MAG: hypothetical protein V1692_00150, partial [bacterium]